MLGKRGFPETWSRLCVCQASFLMTFAMGGVPHAGSQQVTNLIGWLFIFYCYCLFDQLVLKGHVPLLSLIFQELSFEEGVINFFVPSLQEAWTFSLIIFMMLMPTSQCRKNSLFHHILIKFQHIWIHFYFILSLFFNSQLCFFFLLSNTILSSVVLIVPGIPYKN